MTSPAFRNQENSWHFVGWFRAESSSGQSIRRGGITKCGNTHARRALIESAWSYQHPARVSKDIIKRHEGASEAVLSVSWRAQVRLCKRFKRLATKGKPRQVVVTAIARELLAFLWELANVMGSPVKEGFKHNRHLINSIYSKLEVSTQGYPWKGSPRDNCKVFEPQ